MKKLFAVCTLLLSISAVADDATRPTDFRGYAATQRPLMDSGQIPASEYYKGMYIRLLNAGAPAEILDRMSRLILSADLYEGGKIDRPEFEFRRRTIQAEFVSAEQREQSASEARAQAAEREAQLQQQQRSDALLAAGVQLLQNSGPRTLAPGPAAAGSPPGTIMGFLQNQSINGFLRYCRYSNGVVTTISVSTLCPMNTQ